MFSEKCRVPSCGETAQEPLMESDALGSRTGFGGGLHSAGTEQRDTLPDYSDLCQG